MTKNLDIYDVRDWGQGWLSGGDKTAQLNACMTDRAAAGGGIVHVPPGTVDLGGRVVVPQGVSLRCSGRSGVTETGGTRFRLTDAAAGITWADAGANDRGFSSGNFSVDANSLATTPIVIGLMVHTEIENITVEHSPGVGLTYLGAQNSIFRNLHAHDCATGHSVEQGTGGNVFDKISASEATVNHLKMFPNGGTAGGYTNPTDNLFVHPIFERPAQTGYMVDIDEARRNTFLMPTLSAAAGTATPTHILSCGANSTDNTFHDAVFQGGNLAGMTAAVRVDTFRMYLTGRTTAVSLPTAMFDVTGTGKFCSVQDVTISGGGAMFTAGSPANVRNNVRFPIALDLAIEDSSSGVVIPDRGVSNASVRVFYDSTNGGLQVEAIT